MDRRGNGAFWSGALVVVAMLQSTSLSIAGETEKPENSAPGSCDERTVAYHVDHAKALLDHAYRHVRWDEPSIATRRENRRIRVHRLCLTEKADRDRITAYRARVDASRDAWRRRQAKRFRNKYTPYDCGRHGFFAIPCAIVECESRFDFKARNKWSTAGGAYQIIESTWYRNGGKRYSGHYPAAKASEREQHVIGRRVWEREGRGSWQC